MAAPRSRVPHHGPVTPSCPVECLLTVLSMNSFDTFARADGAPFAEPRTVGDVVDLYVRRQLRKIRPRTSPGLGDRGRPGPGRAEPRRPPEAAPGRADRRAARGIIGSAPQGGPVPARAATVTGPPRPCHGPPGHVPARRSRQGPPRQGERSRPGAARCPPPAKAARAPWPIDPHILARSSRRWSASNSPGALAINTQPDTRMHTSRKGNRDVRQPHR